MRTNHLPDAMQFDKTARFPDNALQLSSRYYKNQLRVYQMNKLISRSTSSKNSTSTCNNIALVLLCTVLTTGCGDALNPKPFVFDMTRINQDGSINDGNDYAKQPWACVRDHESGLLWEGKTTAPGF